MELDENLPSNTDSLFNELIYDMRAEETRYTGDLE
jgi:hypothetical protein